MSIKYLSCIVFTLSLFIYAPLNAQLRLGNVNGEINFREGPGSSTLMQKI